MSCCGNNREQICQTNQAPGSDEQTSLQQPPEHNTPVYFQYTGKTGLTVIGGIHVRV